MGSSRATANDSIDPTWLEKPRSELIWCPYRKPTLVGTGESRKGIGTRSAKELGKLAPSLREKGRLIRVTALCAPELEEAAVHRLERLFIKNTGPCETVR